MTNARAQIMNRMKIILSTLASFSITAMVLYLLSEVPSWFIKNNVTGIFAFKSIGDLFVLAIVLVGVLAPIGYAIYNRKRTSKLYTKLFMILLEVVAISSFIPLAFSQNSVTKAHITYMINLTNISYIITLSLLVIGWTASLYVGSSIMKKSPWAFFGLSVPYALIARTTVLDFMSFKSLISMKDFNVDTLYKMLKSGGDLHLMNASQYNLLMTTFLVIVLWIGVKVYGFVWKKTKGWRTTSKKQQKEEKN